jgi:hypothetical protein
MDRIKHRSVAFVTVKVTDQSGSTNYPKYGLCMPSCAGRGEDSTRGADAATKQSENSDKALIQAQRAWVGPRNAAFAAEPAVGKPIEITMEYQNSGHEAALAFIYAIDPFLATTDDDTNGIVAAKLQNYAMSCKNTREWQGGSVIYPTTGGFGGGYTLSVKTKDDFVDEPLTKGEKFLLLQGCFLYQTFDAPRHSYFCYFYKQGFTRIQNLQHLP